MIKHMKKISLVVLLLFLFFTSFLHVFAADTVTEVLGGRYKVDSTIEENSLWYGIEHRTDIAQSSTSVSGGNAAGLGGGGTLVANQYYPQQVNILEVPSRTDVKVVTWQTTTATKWNLNTVRTIAKDYEANHPGWKVIGAINGDFFDINANRPLPYQTNGVQVSEGEFYRSVPSGSTIGFLNDGSSTPFIGGKTVNREIVLTIYNTTGEILERFPIHKHNVAPGADEVSLFNANWNQDKEIVPVDLTTTTAANYYVVEGATKALAGATNDFYGVGEITSTSQTTLTEGDFAILSNNTALNALLETGVMIRAQYEIIGDYADATSLTGAGITLLKDGTLTSQSDVYRHPRTMIGVKADGTIVMGVIDGRQPEDNMYGATQEEMAALMKHYGAVEAYNLDGGGSSTMLIREGNDFRVVNSPSDGRERTDANAILVVALDPEIDYAVTSVSQDSMEISANIIEANGHDINKLYLKIGNQTREVLDGKATFTYLASNTEYLYQFIVEDSEGNQTRLITQDKHNTAKMVPYLIGMKVTRNGSDVEVEASFYDPDGAVTRSSVEMEGVTKVFLISEQGILRNVPDDLSVEVLPISLTYRYDINNLTGYTELTVLYPQARFLRVVIEQVRKVNETIQSILG